MYITRRDRLQRLYNTDASGIMSVDTSGTSVPTVKSPSIRSAMTSSRRRDASPSPDISLLDMSPRSGDQGLLSVSRSRTADHSSSRVLDSRVASIENVVRSSEETLMRLDASTRKQEGISEELKKRVAEMEKKGVGVESSMRRMGHDFDTLHRAIDVVKRECDQQLSDVASEIFQRVDVALATNPQPDVEVCKADLDAVAVDVHAIQGQLTKLQGDCDASTRRLESTLNTKTTQLGDAVSDLHRQLAHRMEEMESAMAGKDAAIATLREEVRQLVGAVKELDSQVANDRSMRDKEGGRVAHSAMEAGMKDIHQQMRRMAEQTENQQHRCEERMNMIESLLENEMRERNKVAAQQDHLVEEVRRAERTAMNAESTAGNIEVAITRKVADVASSLTQTMHRHESAVADRMSDAMKATQQRFDHTKAELEEAVSTALQRVTACVAASDELASKVHQLSLKTDKLEGGVEDLWGKHDREALELRSHVGRVENKWDEEIGKTAQQLNEWVASQLAAYSREAMAKDEKLKDFTVSEVKKISDTVVKHQSGVDKAILELRRAVLDRASEHGVELRTLHDMITTVNMESSQRFDEVTRAARTEMEKVITEAVEHLDSAVRGVKETAAANSRELANVKERLGRGQHVDEVRKEMVQALRKWEGEHRGDVEAVSRRVTDLSREAAECRTQLAQVKEHLEDITAECIHKSHEAVDLRRELEQAKDQLRCGEERVKGWQVAIEDKLEEARGKGEAAESCRALAHRVTVLEEGETSTREKMLTLNERVAELGVAVAREVKGVGAGWAKQLDEASRRVEEKVRREMGEMGRRVEKLEEYDVDGLGVRMAEVERGVQEIRGEHRREVDELVSRVGSVKEELHSEEYLRKMVEEEVKVLAKQIDDDRRSAARRLDELRNDVAGKCMAETQRVVAEEQARVRKEVRAACDEVQEGVASLKEWHTKLQREVDNVEDVVARVRKEWKAKFEVVEEQVTDQGGRVKGRVEQLEAAVDGLSKLVEGVRALEREVEDGKGRTATLEETHRKTREQLTGLERRVRDEVGVHEEATRKAVEQVRESMAGDAMRRVDEATRKMLVNMEVTVGEATRKVREEVLGSVKHSVEEATRRWEDKVGALESSLTDLAWSSREMVEDLGRRHAGSLEKVREQVREEEDARRRGLLEATREQAAEVHRMRERLVAIDESVAAVQVVADRASGWVRENGELREVVALVSKVGEMETAQADLVTKLAEVELRSAQCFTTTKRCILSAWEAMEWSARGTLRFMEETSRRQLLGVEDALGFATSSLTEYVDLTKDTLVTTFKENVMWQMENLDKD